MTPVTVTQGNSSVVLGFPHCGTYVPADVWNNLNETGRALSDTDWHVDHLYDGVMDGLTTVRANFHRYVIDANRDPSGDSLYPGQNTTTLVPLTDFDGLPIWSKEPDAIEIAARRETVHAPYHAALQAELDRVRSIHGFVILYDCHSIRSRIPFLFDGVLPDFNVGTNLGITCAPEIEARAVAVCEAAKGYRSVLNGRFRGGWTTRHYGQPHQGQHAIQMELAQSAYLTCEHAPWTYDTQKAEALRAHLAKILTRLAGWTP